MKEIIETAPWEIASSIYAKPEGKYLYYKGKKYLRPVLSNEEVIKIVESIKTTLNPCNKQCTGLLRQWHLVSRKHL